MCDVTHHKSYGFGLTNFTEVRKRIVYILFDVNIFYSDGSTLYCVCYLLPNPGEFPVPGKIPYPGKMAYLETLEYADLLQGFLNN